MLGELFHPAFIGPGGPELLVVMLVLILMFGAKDAPRIFRKINETISRMRNVADTVKREVMYGDLYDESEPGEAAADVCEYDEEDELQAEAEELCDDGIETSEDGDGDAKRV